MLFDPQGMKRLANGLQRGVQRCVQHYLERKTTSRGAGPVISNTYRGQADFRGTLPELNTLFDRFAYKKLTQWRRTNANAVGTMVMLQYQASRRFRVPLSPLTGWARGRENDQSANNPRYDRGLETISYEYLCEFEFDGQGGRTVVSYVTTETIDAAGTAQRDLTTHYRAPPMPTGFGDIGTLFLEGLRARGLA